MPTWTKEQQEAIEKSGTNIIVSAGAGSGKTAVLSERVIYKLKSGIHIDELLILTFTRAAAEEMKDRIRKKIKKDSSLKRELDALDSSYITTFDSFALSVVKKYHYLLNIKKDISITDDTIVKLEMKKILDRVFEESYKKREDTFTDFIKTYCLKNDRTLKNAILSLIEKIDGYLDREEYLDYIENKFFTEENIRKIIYDFKKLVDEKKRILYLELENGYRFFDEDFIEKINNVVLPILNINTLEEFAIISPVRLPSLKKGAEEETKKAKENIKKALDDLLKLKEYGDEKKIKDDILSTKNTILSIKRILVKFFDELDKYKKENEIYTFSDIAKLSIDILKRFAIARETLRDKFKEIMIDEYQDTNDVQETFISLIANENVYMVGDIKQSIYRFRGSNPDIFKTKYDHYSQKDGGYKIDLIKNFRSRKEVLENINDIFGLIMDDSLGGAAYTVSHEMVFGNEEYLQKKSTNYDYNFEVLEYDSEGNEEYGDDEIEIFTIANDIKNKIDNRLEVFDKNTSLMRPFKYSDAVIILDRSKFFDKFKKIFEHLNIPLTILKDDRLNSSDDLFIIKNLITLFLHIKKRNYDIEFKYAFMSIGRSFLYEYDDQQLFDFLSEEKFKSSKLYEDLDRIDSLYSKTIREILLELLDVTEFYSKIYKVGDYENTNVRLTKLVDIATNLGSMGYTIEMFDEYLGEILTEDMDIKYTAFNDDVDSVKILTIHKSKGLEYPICYFADLAHSFNTRELKDKFIADKKLGIIAPVTLEDEENDNTILKELYKYSFTNDEISEKIRLFYVALTRAREKIIITLPHRDTTKLEKNREGTIESIRRLNFKSLADFIYGIKNYLPAYFKTIDLQKIGLTKDYLYIKENKDVEAQFMKNDFLVSEISLKANKQDNVSYSKKNLELIDSGKVKKMEFGTRIHEILEYIDLKNYEPTDIDDEFIREKVTNFVNSPLIKNISAAKIFKEFEFIYDEKDISYHGIIDLMIEYSDHIDIIDYKLKNVENENYFKQLKGYKNYISTVSNKDINLYLYSILESNFQKIE